MIETASYTEVSPSGRGLKIIVRVTEAFKTVRGTIMNEPVEVLASVTPVTAALWTIRCLAVYSAQQEVAADQATRACLRQPTAGQHGHGHPRPTCADPEGSGVGTACIASGLGGVRGSMKRTSSQNSARLTALDVFRTGGRAPTTNRASRRH